jgi:hypothetical protein
VLGGRLLFARLHANHGAFERDIGEVTSRWQNAFTQLLDDPAADVSDLIGADIEPEAA